MENSKKRTRLTDVEFNLVTTWTRRTKFDSVMDVNDNESGDTVWVDYENDGKELSLEEGFKLMASAVAYSFQYEGFTDAESKILMNLLGEFGVDEGTLDYIRSLNDQEGVND